jgi:hypothetical protein
VRDAKELVKLFEEEGFTLARRQNHQVWRCPCGHATVTVARSSGGGRSSGFSSFGRTLFIDAHASISVPDGTVSTCAQ